MVASSVILDVMKKLPKNLLINIGLLIASLIIFFGGIEVFLRVSGLQSTQLKPSRMYAKPYLQKNENPDIRYDLKPNFSGWAHFSTVTTNDAGFRSSELDIDKPTIAVLGDSMTFGYGVNDDETFPYSLGNLLPEYNILNAGVPGYNLEQERATYEQKIQQLDPKALILVFYFNDFQNEKVWIDDKGILRPENWTGEEVRECNPIEDGLMGFIPGKCWLDLHSTFYLAIKKAVNLRSSIEEADEERVEAQEGLIDDPVTQENLDYYAEELAKLTALIPASLPRLFVIWPDRYLHPFAIPKLEGIAKRNGFKTLNLYEVIGNDFETLTWDYTHPNGETCERAAVAVFQSLQEHVLLDRM